MLSNICSTLCYPLTVKKVCGVFEEQNGHFKQSDESWNRPKKSSFSHNFLFSLLVQMLVVVVPTMPSLPQRQKKMKFEWWNIE